MSALVAGASCSRAAAAHSCRAADRWRQPTRRATHCRAAVPPQQSTAFGAHGAPKRAGQVPIMRVQAMATAQDPAELVERTKPCTWELPEDALGRKISGGGISLSLRLTYPKGASNGARLPIVMFFSGFLASAHWYQQIADHMAAAGFAVVQYDAPPLRGTGFLLEAGLRFPMVFFLKKEVAVFEPLMAALHAELPWAAKVPKGLMDTQRVLLAGHSRGGALASLILADFKSTKSKQYKVLGAYLLDPVDPPFGQASAGAELLKSKLAVGITPANISGPFNGPGLNYTHFYSSDSGSRLDVIEKIKGFPCVWLTHMMFCDAGFALDRVMDLSEWIYSKLPLKEREALSALVEKKGVEAVVLEVFRSSLPASSLLGACGTADDVPTCPEAAPLFEDSDLTDLQKKVLQRLKGDLAAAIFAAARRMEQGSVLSMSEQAAGGFGPGAVAKGLVHVKWPRAVVAQMAATNMLKWLKEVS